MGILVLFGVLVISLAFITSPVSADDGTGDAADIPTVQTPVDDLPVDPQVDVITADPDDAQDPVIIENPTSDEIPLTGGDAALVESSVPPADVVAPVVDELIANTDGGNKEKKKDEEPSPAEVLEASLDPFFNRGGLTYYFRTNCTGFDNCVVTSTPISSAVTDVTSNGLPDDGVINVEGGTYQESLVIGALPGALKLKGSVNGQTTYLNGGVIIYDNGAPLTFADFVFNSGVNLIGTTDVSFENSTFNAGLFAENSQRTSLKKNKVHAGVLVMDSSQLRVSDSQFMAGVLISDSSNFSIDNSELQSGLIISRSTGGIISDSILSGWINTRSSEVTINTTSAKKDLAINMGQEENHVVVNGESSLQVAGVSDNQADMNLNGGTIVFGESKVSYNSTGIQNLGVVLDAPSDSAISVNDQVTVNGLLDLQAPVILVNNSINADQVNLTGDGQVVVQGNITTINDMRISGDTLTINSRIESTQADIQLLAANGITVGENGQVIASHHVLVNADTDQNGIGTFSLLSGGLVKGLSGIEITAAALNLLGNLQAGQAVVSLVNSNPSGLVGLGSEGDELFQIGQAEFEKIQAGKLIIGNLMSRGTVSIGHLDLGNTDYKLDIFGGNIEVNELVLAFAGMMQLVAFGFIQSKNNSGKINIQMPGGSLQVKALGFGTAAAPIHMLVDFFSALVNCVGSVYVSDLNHTDLPEGRTGKPGWPQAVRSSFLGQVC
jgi:hypothetical protein